jgi:hypothetical protein
MLYNGYNESHLPKGVTMKITAICLSAGLVGFVLGNMTGFKAAKVTIVAVLEERIPIAVKMLSDSYRDLANGTITSDELEERLKSDMEFMNIVSK